MNQSSRHFDGLPLNSYHLAIWAEDIEHSKMSLISDPENIKRKFFITKLEKLYPLSFLRKISKHSKTI